MCLASLAVAWVRGASPLQRGTIGPRLVPLPSLALLVQVLAFRHMGDLAAPYALASSSEWDLCWSSYWSICGIALALVALDTGLNLTVIIANGGYMPVGQADIERAGFPHIAERLASQGRFEKSRPRDETTRLPWLADVIHVPLPGPDRLMSAGDLLVAAGVFLLIQEALVIRPRSHAPEQAGRKDRAGEER